MLPRAPKRPARPRPRSVRGAQTPNTAAISSKLTSTSISSTIMTMVMVLLKIELKESMELPYGMVRALGSSAVM